MGSLSVNDIVDNFAMQVRSGRGHARVYGYQQTTLRSHEENLQYATEAEATKMVITYISNYEIIIMRNECCKCRHM